MVFFPYLLTCVFNFPLSTEYLSDSLHTTLSVVKPTWCFFPSVCGNLYYSFSLSFILLASRLIATLLGTLMCTFRVLVSLSPLPESSSCPPWTDTALTWVNIVPRRATYLMGTTLRNKKKVATKLGTRRLRRRDKDGIVSVRGGVIPVRDGGGG